MAMILLLYIIPIGAQIISGFKVVGLLGWQWWIITSHVAIIAFSVLDIIAFFMRH
jgi:hypothetical protein